MTNTLFEPASLSDFLLRVFPKEHLSASLAKQWVKCPEQVRRVKFLGHKAKPSAAMEWGSADHDTAGFNYQQKIITEKDLPAAELQEHFVNEFEQRVENLGGPDEIEWDGDKDFAGKTPKQGVTVVKDKGVKLVSVYREQIAESLFPLTVEEELFFQPEGLPLPVKGYIDVTARRRDGITGEMSGPMILERKTRGSLREPKPEDKFQARVYQLAKPLPAEFHISSRPNAKVGTWNGDPIEVPERTVASLKAVLLEIAACWSLYGLDHPWPDRGRLHDWACSYCALKPTCPWWHEEWWPR